jgi:hypothetical protein
MMVVVWVWGVLKKKLVASTTEGLGVAGGWPGVSGGASGRTGARTRGRRHNPLISFAIMGASPYSHRLLDAPT